MAPPWCRKLIILFFIFILRQNSIEFKMEEKYSTWCIYLAELTFQNTHF